jgi:hypothetical protein
MGTGHCGRRERLGSGRAQERQWGAVSCHAVQIYASPVVRGEVEERRRLKLDKISVSCVKATCEKSCVEGDAISKIATTTSHNIMKRSRTVNKNGRIGKQTQRIFSGVQAKNFKVQ